MIKYSQPLAHLLVELAALDAVNVLPRNLPCCPRGNFFLCEQAIMQSYRFKRHNGPADNWEMDGWHRRSIMYTR